MKKEKCLNEHICPYGTKPQTGMYANVNGIAFWGTDCIAYIDCPRKYWKEKQWKSNPTKAYV